MSTEFDDLECELPMAAKSDAKAKWAPPKFKQHPAVAAEFAIGNSVDGAPNAS
ncbi:MAG TPA: hypothetical protein VGC36_00085 [Rhizomicrobium sp.]